MTTEPTSTVPFEADEADVLEQHQPASNGDLDIEEPDIPDDIPLDADTADVIDQHITVPVHDDDWPT